MKEHFSSEERRQSGKVSIEERLSRHPHLKSRFEDLLDIVENASGDLEKADAAERRVIEELRQMGAEVLRGWAENQESRKSEELEKGGGRVRHKEKKPLLAHVLRKNRSRGKDLHVRRERRDDPAVFHLRGGSLPGILGTAAASDRGFWFRFVVWKGARQAEGTLRNRGSNEFGPRDYSGSR